METDRSNRLDYCGIGMFAILFVGFVVVQPIQQSYAVEGEGAVQVEAIPGFEDCDDQFLVDVSMDTVRSKNVILTTHSEKEIFECFTVQGNIEVLVEVTLVAQIYENTRLRIS